MEAIIKREPTQSGDGQISMMEISSQ
jgi:hypothetical protein